MHPSKLLNFFFFYYERRVWSVGCYVILIFFFQNSEHYELLNYSCHGTIVNGAVYGIDLSLPIPNRCGKRKHSSARSHNVRLSRAIRDIVDRTKGI